MSGLAAGKTRLNPCVLHQPWCNAAVKRSGLGGCSVQERFSDENIDLAGNGEAWTDPRLAANIIRPFFLTKAGAKLSAHVLLIVTCVVFATGKISPKCQVLGKVAGDQATFPKLATWVRFRQSKTPQRLQQATAHRMHCTSLRGHTTNASSETASETGTSRMHLSGMVQSGREYRDGTPVCLQDGKTTQHPRVPADADLFNSATLLWFAVTLITCSITHCLLCTLLCWRKSPGIT